MSKDDLETTNDLESQADYNIYPIKEDPTKLKYKPCGEKLLTPCFNYAIIASKHTGKTVLCQNLVCRPYPFYGGCFDRIILISGTLAVDRSARYLREYIGQENCWETYDDRIIDGLIEQQDSVEPEDQEKILIIADDLPSLNVSQNARIYTLAATHRHRNINLIYISQILRSQSKGGGLPQITRNNIEGYFIGRQSNKKVLNSIMEELSHFQDEKSMLACYNDIVAGNPFSFMFCNSRNLSIRDNFGDIVFQRYDENGNYNPDYTPKRNNNPEAVELKE